MTVSRKALEQAADERPTQAGAQHAAPLKRVGDEPGKWAQKEKG